MVCDIQYHLVHYLGVILHLLQKIRRGTNHEPTICLRFRIRMQIIPWSFVGPSLRFMEKCKTNPLSKGYLSYFAA